MPPAQLSTVLTTHWQTMQDRLTLLTSPHKYKMQSKQHDLKIFLQCQHNIHSKLTVLLINLKTALTYCKELKYYLRYKMFLRGVSMNKMMWCIINIAARTSITCIGVNWFPQVSAEKKRSKTIMLSKWFYVNK